MFTIVCFGDLWVNKVSVIAIYNCTLKIEIKHRYNYTDSALSERARSVKSVNGKHLKPYKQRGKLKLENVLQEKRGQPESVACPGMSNSKSTFFSLGENAAAIFSFSLFSRFPPPPLPLPSSPLLLLLLLNPEGLFYLSGCVGG